MKLTKTTRKAIEDELKEFLDGLQDEELQSLNFGRANSEFAVSVYRSEDYAQEGTIRDEARP